MDIQEFFDRLAAEVQKGMIVPAFPGQKEGEVFFYCPDLSDHLLDVVSAVATTEKGSLVNDPYWGQQILGIPNDTMIEIQEASIRTLHPLRPKLFEAVGLPV